MLGAYGWEGDAYVGEACPRRYVFDNLFARVNSLISIAGKVKGVVDSVYPFGDVLKAYEKIMTGRASGKVVVQVEV